MKIILRIQRYNPETDSTPHFQEYPVDVEPTGRLLDAILYVKQHVDATLAVRKSCAHGICGSDAMRVNGTERLACKTIVKDIAGDGDVVVLQPLRSMPVQRDLMVDQNAFFEKYRSVKPFLIPAAPQRPKEQLQMPQQRMRYDDPTKCILCGACYSSCPVVAGKNPQFIGPAAVLQAARFVFDSRDIGIRGRVAELDMPNGVWACENHFDCTKACPRTIKVTKSINEIKRSITVHKENKHQTV